MNILTANVKLNSNLSYGIVARRLFRTLKNYKTVENGVMVEKPINWFYGEYGENYSSHIKDSLATLVPFPLDEQVAPRVDQYAKYYDLDLLIMHDDLQRCKWIKSVNEVPVLLWLPWDNEDMSNLHYRDTLNHADRIAVLGKFAQEKLAEQGMYVDQVYDPIDTNQYYPDDEAGKSFKEQVGVPEDHKIITFIGRPGWRKRPFHIIKVASEIMKKRDDVHFIFHTDLINEPSWGINPKELLYGEGILDHDRLITPEGFKYNVGFPPEVINQIYNATDVYFAPHGGEGMGLPLAEAMSAGKPIVATDYTTTREFCGYDKNSTDLYGSRGIGAKIGTQPDGSPMVFRDKGIMRPYVDINDMVEKIEYLLDNPTVCEKMGKNGRKFAEENLDVRVVSSKLFNIVRDLTDYTPGDLIA